MERRQQHILLSRLYGSARVRELSRVGAGCYLVLLEDEDAAKYWYRDLTTLGAQALYFPASMHKSRVDDAMVIQRTSVLCKMVSKCWSVPVRAAKPPLVSKCWSENVESVPEGIELAYPLFIVTYPAAMEEPTPTKEDLMARTVVFRTGEQFNLSELTDLLTDMGFERVDFVYEPGQFAVRGGIVDIFSFSNDAPYRLDFFGNEIDSIRTIDIETQLSDKLVRECWSVNVRAAEPPLVSKCWEVKVESEKLKEAGFPGDQVPDRKFALRAKEESGKLKDYLPEDTVYVATDFAVIDYPPGARTIEIRDKSTFDDAEVITFDTLPQPIFHKNFDLLEEDLRSKLAEGYHIHILAEQPKQLDRLHAILNIDFKGENYTLHEGWVDRAKKEVWYTDHQIFERYHRVSLRSENARRGKAILTLKEINQLRIDDYVVHQDHGIGQFGGLVTTKVNGKEQEMIKLLFRDGDSLYVSIHNLNRLSKYKGKEGSAPTISKLGSGAWERLKERTKDKVKDIARDLIQLYAKRKQHAGFAYSPDGYMQHELEASFFYEDTPDQAKATAAIKKDLESSRPMDRLVCGDVGFGKTEVAMRAAFKVATDGKQVAVLVPTTVLALQHYKTFTERFKDFPVTIDYLSRAKSPAETKQTLDRLKEGRIDVLIGTHKLVGKNVHWHDLGLLIIDEEQKFGVAVKEKIKSYRANIDVLTLTATPIPRTLQFSLLGARDLSVINTPPPNRYPIQTEVVDVNDADEVVRDAIEHEMERNGQVFLVNNRIDMLPRMENWVRRLCPSARVITAHGQMPPDEMADRLEAFINYDYDVLISTTIVESGVDIPNVNTMIIYSAQHYGLADLHQLRGRVGRSNRKAYCYLLTPERELLTSEARRRLDAIGTFSELGSGFNLAMQDLDIRGAGNMLGAEQSGFIAELGYETYQRVLNEAVAELKEEMLLDEPDDRRTEPPDKDMDDAVTDVQLETDLPLSLPAEYVENVSERITLYRELDSLRNEAELSTFKARLIDRFGAMPEEAEELLKVVPLRRLCAQMGVNKIFLRGEHMTLFYPKSDAALTPPSGGRGARMATAKQNVLDYVLHRSQRCRIVPKDKETLVIIDQVRTVDGALTLLHKIMTHDF